VVVIDSSFSVRRPESGVGGACGAELEDRADGGHQPGQDEGQGLDPAGADPGQKATRSESATACIWRDRAAAIVFAYDHGLVNRPG
jgi:hypothetical protein